MLTLYMLLLRRWQYKSWNWLVTALWPQFGMDNRLSTRYTVRVGLKLLTSFLQIFKCLTRWFRCCLLLMGMCWGWLSDFTHSGKHTFQMVVVSLCCLQDKCKGSISCAGRHWASVRSSPSVAHVNSQDCCCHSWFIWRQMGTVSGVWCWWLAAQTL